MAILRLTPANILFVERSLRRTFSNVKAAHLTEGLAAAIGENVHASIGAQATNPGDATTARLDGELWRRRLAELGYSNISDEPLGAILRDNAIPDPCWLVTSKRDSTAINKWFYRCKHESIPYVYVSKARKYACLHWDCISTNGSGDSGVTDDRGEEVVKQMFNHFSHLAGNDTGKPVFHGSAFVGSIERLSPSTAFILADYVFLRLFYATRPDSDPNRKIFLHD